MSCWWSLRGRRWLGEVLEGLMFLVSASFGGRVERADSRIDHGGIAPLGKFAQSCGIRVDQIPTTGFKDWTVRTPPILSVFNINLIVHISQIPTDFQPANTSPSPILITASFGHIIPWKFLSDHFPQPQTRLNVHPSLLPVYRGAAPIQWAIADSWRGGEKGSTGVTVQSLGRRVDCGEIWGQEGGIVSRSDRLDMGIRVEVGQGG
jgi:hypothetical protein